MENKVHEVKIVEKNGKQNLLTKKDFVIANVVGLAGIPAFANAADFALDTSTIMTAVGVVLAGVTAVGLGALAIPLVIKGIKYLKAAF